MAIKINTYEEAKRLAEQYAASGQAPQRSYTGLSTAIRFADDAGTQANDIARHQADAIKQAQNIATNFNDAYSRDLSELSNEATNIANQRDYTGLTPSQIAAEQSAFGSRQTDFDRRVSDFNKNYSSFGLEAFKAPTMQVGANGYIEQVGANGQPVTAALTGVVDRSNELAAANNQQPGTQPTQSSVDRAFSPTDYSNTAGLSDLQRNVMGANASALANAEFVNGAFKAFHNRDATAEELKAYVGKPVGASRTEIIGGAQAAGLPTVAPGTVDVPVGMMTPEEAIAQGLQRVLRPDQLSAFRPDQIIRDNRGGIYLNTETTTQAQRDSVQSGVSGNQIGRSDPGIVGDPRVSAEDASNASQAPDPVEFADVMSNTDASAADQAAVITDTATSYIESILGAYNTQLAQYDTQLAQRKAEMETLTGRVEAMSTATPNADALAAAKEAEGIREKQAKIVDIQSQIALEQERMQLGMIKEGNKLAPLSILGRRQATVEAQGLARIGALTAIAQVYQGDLSFAMDMVNATVSAMNADRTLQMNALDTLITLKDKQIVQLTDEENAVVEARQKAISDAMASAEKDAERAFDLIKEFPDAALKGGVSLSDSAAVALSKMAPYMAEAEEAKAAGKAAGSAAESLTANQRLDAAQRLMTADKTLSLSDALAQVDAAVAGEVWSPDGGTAQNWDSWASSIGNGSFSQDYDTPASYFADGRTTHSGYDITGPLGSPISAPIGGTVVKVVTNQSDAKTGYGNEVQIKDANGNIWRFGHLKGTDLKVGQEVTPGLLIGAMGSTGYSTGSHLHVEVKDAAGVLVDPKTVLTGDATMSYSSFLTALGEEMQMSVDPNSSFAKNLYDEYLGAVGGGETEDNSSADDYLLDIVNSTDKKNMIKYGLDPNKPEDIRKYLNDYYKREATSSGDTEDDSSNPFD